MENPKVYVAIPLMAELENLSQLIRDLSSQSYPNFEVYFCVNQPETYFSEEENHWICENNAESMDYLRKQKAIPIHIIDKSSPGKAWTGKHFGVGIARKTLMDQIAENANPDDILVSLDGDTRFSPRYIASVVQAFKKNPHWGALSNPYYHNLTQDNEVDRAILRYEIYMRYYAIQMMLIKSPYAFTALGSAISFRIKDYKAIGGMSPKKSGEDFYFLQKMAKYKNVGLWNTEKVFPQARFSNRVFFGTGPAMIKGAAGDWDSYPIYDEQLFQEIKGLYEIFGALFTQDIPNIADAYLGEDWYKPLRKNATSEHAFIRACYYKFDGLRALQYLKDKQKSRKKGDAFYLKDYLMNLGGTDLIIEGYPDAFVQWTNEQLQEIRIHLMNMEDQLHKDIQCCKLS